MVHIVDVFVVKIINKVNSGISMLLPGSGRRH